MPSACTAEPPTPTGSCYTREVVEFESNSVAVGDFDGDGFLDVAAADVAETSVLFLGGDGTGTLATPSPFTLTGDHEFQGELARFRRLAGFPMSGADRLFSMANFPPAGRQLWWSELAALSLSRFEPTVFGSARELFGDLDGDGNDDVLVLYNDFAMLSLCSDVACGELTTQTPQNLEGPVSLAGAALVDFDEDGRADLVTVSRDDGVHIRWWRNEGDGVFATEPFEVDPLSLAGSGDMSWTFGDLDGDGHADLGVAVGAGADQTRIRVWPRLADGGFGVASTVDTFGDTLTLSAADLEGDGVDELVQLRSGALVLWGASEGVELERIGELGFDGARFNRVGSDAFATGDLDGDGLLDFVLPVVGASRAREILVLRTGA